MADVGGCYRRPVASDATPWLALSARLNQGRQLGIPSGHPGSALTNWCVESVESLVDLVHGVKQVHGQPQIAFAICGIYSAVRELMVTLLSGAVLAGKHN
jgi:hypothetical protein